MAAALRAEGFTDVSVSTLRPRRPWRRDAREDLRGAQRVLVCDDPPRTGNVLRRALAQIESAGFSSGAITLLLARFEPAAGGALLEGRDEITLPYEDWHVQRRLAPDAVRSIDRMDYFTARATY